MLPPCRTRNPDTACTIPGRSGQTMVSTKSPVGVPALADAGRAMTEPHSRGEGYVAHSATRCRDTQQFVFNAWRGCRPCRVELYGPVMPTGRASEGVQSVERALNILEILARVGECGVTEIAAELEVHKSTAFRLMSTLESHDLVEQTEDRGKYRLGVGMLRLAGATTARLDLVQEARPVCRKLAADTGETVNLAVLSDNSALYVDQVAGTSALQSHNWVGQHIPLHATSNGKVLLSELDKADLDGILATLPSY